MTTAAPAPVMVRNKMAGPTVLASDPKSTHEVIWSGRGAPDGGDVQPVPEEILRTPAFARNLALGVIEIISGAEDNELASQALKVQSDAFWKRSAEQEETALASLEPAADNDLVAVACIGPGSRPGASCEEQIPVRARELNAAPPLCSRHLHLADQCIRRGTGPWQIEAAG